MESPPPVRLARTVAPDGGSYPTAISLPTCYPIIFLDGTYTRVAGAQTPTWTDRQNIARDVAYNLADDQQYSYVPVGTTVAVWFKNNRWWFCWHTTGGGGSTIHFGTLTSNLDSAAAEGFILEVPDGICLNTFSLAGLTGDSVAYVFSHTEGEGEEAVDNYHILQVQHHVCDEEPV